MENPTIYLYDHFDNEVPYYEIKEMLDYSSLDLVSAVKFLHFSINKGYSYNTNSPIFHKDSHHYKPLRFRI